MKLVTTIIPAFNAAMTLDRTLQSALDQTYPLHEILVVDDGSTDNTGRIAKSFASRHPNIRIVRKENRGLAAARNSGIEEAAGAYVAPLDADDLWHPEKIARQVAAIEAMPGAAISYGWFRKIDGDGSVLPVSASPRVSGKVYHRHLDWNFVSNGSTPLVRTDVAREIRYDPGMTLGCEDYLFQVQIARLYRFAVVPGWVTGYRRVAGSMSTHSARMIRAHLQMYAVLGKDADPFARAIIRAQVARLEIELARNRGRRGALPEAWRSVGRAVRADPRAAVVTIGREASRALDRARYGLFAPPERPFVSYRLDEPDGVWTSGRSSDRDAWLTALDNRLSQVATA